MKSFEAILPYYLYGNYSYCTHTYIVILLYISGCILLYSLTKNSCIMYDIFKKSNHFASSDFALSQTT